jgi:DNA repair exonuclease SbcCD nuclease subunit
MTDTFLVIGDMHYKMSNYIQCLEFEKECVDVLKNNPDVKYIVLLGDLLHTHEKINSFCLNNITKFINILVEKYEVYIIVGNHDFVSNQEYMTENHWMNVLKGRQNLHIIDKTEILVTNNCHYTFVPYVFPGRFIESLDTIEYWKESSVIFCHQEFRGCTYNSMTSQLGDLWDEAYPQIISGHIHNQHWVGKNIYYPGTPMHSMVLEKTRDIDGNVTIVRCGFDSLDIENIPLNLSKFTIHESTLENVEEMLKELMNDPRKNNRHRINIMIEDTNKWKLFQKEKLYKSCEGSNITFNLKKKNTFTTIEKKNPNNLNFYQVLEKMVKDEKDIVLEEDYKMIFKI